MASGNIQRAYIYFYAAERVPIPLKCQSMHTAKYVIWRWRSSVPARTPSENRENVCLQSGQVAVWLLSGVSSVSVECVFSPEGGNFSCSGVKALFLNNGNDIVYRADEDGISALGTLSKPKMLRFWIRSWDGPRQTSRCANAKRPYLHFAWFAGGAFLCCTHP